MAELPLLVVTLPARGLPAAREEIPRARDAGADVVELRIDRWPPGEREHVGELLPSPIPLMVTLRSRAEGGEGPDSAEDRQPTLRAAARLPNGWLDLEEDRDLGLLSELPAGASPLLVLSTHLSEGTLPDDLVARSHRPLPPNAIRKIVLPASVGRLVNELVPALDAAAGGSTVVLTTGASGSLLRADAMRRGFPLVYAALPAGPGLPAAAPVEPSQIPVDRLRWYFEGGHDRPLFALLGRPVGHSQSPYLHSRWMRRSRHHGLYVALEIGTETEFVEALEPLAQMGLRGANVTHPWKTAALASATRVGNGAEVTGVANCLTFRDGEVEAENTDLAAALRRLEELRSDGRWDGGELLVVGAGGSAAATLAAARELGSRAMILARSDEKAGALASRLGARVLTAEETRPFRLVVQATDVGRAGASPLELPLERAVGPGTLVLDWVYSADDDLVRRTTRDRGGDYEDGWRLLVYQAAASYGVWWGVEPDADEVSATIREGPCGA